MLNSVPNICPVFYPLISVVMYLGTNFTSRAQTPDMSSDESGVICEPSRVSSLCCSFKDFGPNYTFNQTYISLTSWCLAHLVSCKPYTCMDTMKYRPFPI